MKSIHWSIFLYVSISWDYQQMNKNYFSNLVYNPLDWTSYTVRFLRQHKETEDRKETGVWSLTNKTAFVGSHTERQTHFGGKLRSIADKEAMTIYRGRLRSLGMKKFLQHKINLSFLKSVLCQTVCQSWDTCLERVGKLPKSSLISEQSCFTTKQSVLLPVILLRSAAGIRKSAWQHKKLGHIACGTCLLMPKIIICCPIW